MLAQDYFKREEFDDIGGERPVFGKQPDVVVFAVPASESVIYFRAANR
jgi:hypothetical protein